MASASPASAFALAHAFTARWEGGFADHPADPGGATAYGVSLRFLKGEGLDLDGDGAVDAKDLRSLTPTSAAGLFRSFFWDKPGLSRLPLQAAVAVYDTGVNAGCARAIRMLQNCCNLSLPAGTLLPVTGVLDADTLSRAASCNRDAAARVPFTQKLLELRADYYRALARKRPALAPFLKGWLNRTDALSAYLRELPPNLPQDTPERSA